MPIKVRFKTALPSTGLGVNHVGLRKGKKNKALEAPAPGLFDWLFGATEDPDKPAAASSPLAPTQPVAVPTTVSSLALSVTDATKNPNPA